MRLLFVVYIVIIHPYPTCRLRAGTLAMGEDKKEIERLKAELEVQLERIEVLQVRCG